MQTEHSSDGLGYPWYARVADESLAQGGFFFAFPVIVPVDPADLTTDARETTVDLAFFDVVVLSQSCDRDLGKVDNVLVCPHFSLTDAKAAVPHLQQKRGREDARRGTLPAYHVLESCALPGFEQEPRIVTFAQVFTVPLSYARAQASSGRLRLRLLPPYRERLAHAFARFVMRVGLPQDVASLD